MIATSSKAYPTLYPNPAWVEQNPEEYWHAVTASSRAIVEKTAIDPAEIKGIVFSTQAQGVIPVDKDGNVLYNNITWVDGRAQKAGRIYHEALGRQEGLFPGGRNAHHG